MGSRIGTAAAPHVDGDPFWGLARSPPPTGAAASRRASRRLGSYAGMASSFLPRFGGRRRPAERRDWIGRGGARSDDHSPQRGGQFRLSYRPARRGAELLRPYSVVLTLRMATHTRTRSESEWPRLAGPTIPRRTRLARPRSRGRGRPPRGISLSSSTRAPSGDALPELDSGFLVEEAHRQGHPSPVLDDARR